MTVWGKPKPSKTIFLWSFLRCLIFFWFCFFVLFVEEMLELKEKDSKSVDNNNNNNNNNDDDSKPTGKLEASTHTFPFEFTLPSNLPPSFQTDGKDPDNVYDSILRASCRYSIKAYVDIALLSDPYVTQSLIVQSRVNPVTPFFVLPKFFRASLLNLQLCCYIDVLMCCV